MENEKKGSIEFNGSEINTVKMDGIIYVAIKSIVLSLGGNWKTQQNKIRAESEKYQAEENFFPNESGQYRVLTCVKLSVLDVWLHSVKVLSKYNDKLTLYQRDCSKVINEYWNIIEKDLQPTTIPQTYKEALLQVVSQIERSETLQTQNESLQKQLTESTPKIEFAEIVASAKSNIYLRAFSKLLSQDNLKIGEKRLFKLFEKHGIFINYDEPYQKYIEAGYFKVVERSYSDKKENKQLYNRVMITPKGQLYFARKIKFWVNPPKEIEKTHNGFFVDLEESRGNKERSIQQIN